LPHEASNEWAVDGSHTASGAPLLAGDPHLGLGFPSLWYLVRIDTPEGVLAGATAPGVPFLVIGHNAHIAWTFTTTGADTQDVFVETALPDGTYQTPDGPAPFITHEEVIKVRGEPDVRMIARETRHGPVISDLDTPSEAENRNKVPVLAVEMMNLAPGNSAAAGLLALDRARNIAEAGKAAALITAPVQNLLVADRDGIGMFTTGRVPIRRAGNGSMPVPGADGRYDWIGYASGEQLPHILAPANGQFVNANERVAATGSAVFMGRDWPGDWRARRIKQMLAGSAHLTAADFAHMQVDVTSEYAAQILPTLNALEVPSGPAAKAANLLRNWDGRMTVDAPQPLIFNAWVQRFDRAILERAGIAGSWHGPWMEFSAWVLTPAGAAWCGGDCRPILRDALERAVDELSVKLGPDPAAWRWGDMHRAIFAHPMLGRMPLIGWFATAAIAQPGDASTVFAGGAPLGNLESHHGPEFRGVYDLGDLDRSLFVMTPGQSGNLLSRYAWNFLQPWRDGGTVTLGPVAQQVEERLTLVP
jgi:penicillin amidase